jgi:hypothetical protein
MGAVAKSYLRKDFLINEEMRKYLVIYMYKEAVIVIYDFATASFWISLHMKNILCTSIVKRK